MSHYLCFAHIAACVSRPEQRDDVQAVRPEHAARHERGHPPRRHVCIEALREHLINVVASDWPTTLEEWDFFQAEVQAVKNKLATTNLRTKETGGEDY